MKLFKSVILILIFCGANSSSFVQVTPEWIQRYNGPGNQNDNAYSIALDDSGNVYVTGQSPGVDTYDDYATIKYNSSGIQQWIARYDGPVRGNDAAFSMVVDASGNIYVTGESYGGLSDYDYDYATLKYNSSGIEQWVERYKGPANDFDAANCITVDASGNVYVTGESVGLGTGYDYVTIKYNSSGVQQWIARYNGPGYGDDYSYSVVVDVSGNVYVTGQCYVNEDDYDFATIKYNSNGALKWITRYDGPLGNKNDIGAFLAIDNSGNVYVTGRSSGEGTNWWDYATIKYNSEGIQQWVATYNGTGNNIDWTRSLKLDASGNVYVTGASVGFGGSSDYATIKYNSSGVMQWVKSYNGPAGEADEAFSMEVDSFGNVYVTGVSTGNGTGKDYATIKYNSSGGQQWIQRYNGPSNGDDYAYKMVVDASGNAYVTGGSGPNYDYATIKYSQTVGIPAPLNIIPEIFALYQNYPNPFNPSTLINYSIKENSFVSLKVYDVLGNEVATLVNEKQNPGSYNYQFSTVKYQLASGIYFYKLIAGSYTDTKRMILLK